MNSERRIEVLLSTQRALLDEITPQMRRVVAHYDDTSLLVVFHVDGEPTDVTIDAVDCVETELLADFHATICIETIIRRADMPQRIYFSQEKEHMVVIYARRERPL